MDPAICSPRHASRGGVARSAVDDLGGQGAPPVAVLLGACDGSNWQVKL